MALANDLTIVNDEVVSNTVKTVQSRATYVNLNNHEFICIIKHIEYWKMKLE